VSVAAVHRSVAGTILTPVGEVRAEAGPRSTRRATAAAPEAGFAAKAV
jgi:hypothetical protein